MKQITITVPDNCELKQNGNTYTIVEKEKKLTYNDVAEKLFGSRKDIHYIGEYGEIFKTKAKRIYDLNNCTSEKQAKKLLAINKLMNVAKYLNGDWQPDWNDAEECKHYISLEHVNNNLSIDCTMLFQENDVYFKSEELAQQAIEILGEETIKLALCTDY